MQLDQSLNTHEVKKECTDERIANLEVELAKVRSKRDECQLQMLEFKNNYASQAKAADSFERKLRQSEYECSQMRLNYESCMTELRVLSEANAQYETCVRELEFKVNDEHVVTARGRQNMEDVIQRLVKSYQEQQKKIEAVVGAYKVQSMHVQTLRDLVEKFREQFSYTKPKLYEHQFQFNQNQNHSMIENFLE
jgi:chromosome segregation ATPase